MATILTGDQIPDIQPYGRYPWDQWTDGQWRRIVHGVDFHVVPPNMRVMLYSRAKRDGLKVVTHTGVESHLEDGRRVWASPHIDFKFIHPANP